MKYHDRDISWLSFNARVLQEVENASIPLFERLNFAAIYSSNLEEFYRVRVAAQRFLQNYDGDKKNKFGYRPSQVLHQINLIVSEQQQKLGRIFYKQLVPAMSTEGIGLSISELSPDVKLKASDYFKKHLKQTIVFTEITNQSSVQMKNQAVYLYIIHYKKLFLCEIEYSKYGRFIELSENEPTIIQLDDIIKNSLNQYFNDEVTSFAIKVSRDAELYINDEQEEDLVKKIAKSLKKRNTGLPSRLLFDENIPFKYIDILRKKIGLDISALIPGGAYHNFYDFFNFPRFKQKSHLYYPSNQVLNCPLLDANCNWFNTISKHDIFLSFPYQSFSYITQWLNMAAADKQVTEIDLTIYRVSKTSAVCQAIETAALNGKKVFILVEVQARFDEEANMYWGERLKKAGAVVKYSTQNLKVHAKAISILRNEEGAVRRYAYLGTGNLNESTAKIYADHGILTADTNYTSDLNRVFNYLKNETSKLALKHLLVAPFTMRNSLIEMIDREIVHAHNKVSASIILKLNSLEDLEMIDKLREAADAGVKINMIIRGICCYTPLTNAQSNNIKIVAIIDRYLEHTRIYHFNNNGDSKTYLSSADWMNRNLSKRIELAFPIKNLNHKQLLIKEIEVQLNDNVKGRVVDTHHQNAYVLGSNTKSAQQQMSKLVQNLL